MLPQADFIDIRRWHAEGHGYRRIARLLEDLGVFTTRSSIHRLLKGLALYPKKSTKNTVEVLDVDMDLVRRRGQRLRSPECPG